MPKHDKTVAERLHRVRVRVAAIREQFREAHVDGMQAMERGDKAGFGDAVRRETALLEEFTTLIAVATGRRQRQS